ncbi:hypothetical protein HDE_00665 [Halotydeus destructor]|nr:hypothetical protein HDE_00665 [Halotydeus destructor]
MCSDNGKAEDSGHLALHWLDAEGQVVNLSRDSQITPLEVMGAAPLKRRIRLKDVMSVMVKSDLSLTAMVEGPKVKSGIYRCVLTDERTNEILDQKALKVNMFNSMEILQPPPEVLTTSQGSDVSLPCHILFDPSLVNTKVIWYKDGYQVRFDNRIYVKTTIPPEVRSTLYIGEAEMADSGKYECKASQGTNKATQVKYFHTVLDVVE